MLMHPGHISRGIISLCDADDQEAHEDDTFPTQKHKHIGFFKIMRVRTAGRSVDPFLDYVPSRIGILLGTVLRTYSTCPCALRRLFQVCTYWARGERKLSVRKGNCQWGIFNHPEKVENTIFVCRVCMFTPDSRVVSATHGTALARCD